MADALFEFYQGTGVITDNEGGSIGERSHSNRGVMWNYANAFYEIETEENIYQLHFGAVPRNDYDDELEGLFYLQIRELDKMTGEYRNQEINSEGGIFLYHCNEPDQLEELPHQVMPEEDLLKEHEVLPKGYRNTMMEQVAEDAEIENTFGMWPHVYFSYYDGEMTGLHLEVVEEYGYKDEQRMYYHYTFDPETLDILTGEHYEIFPPIYGLE